MKDQSIDACIRILKREIRRWKEPVVGVVAKASCDPFQILISTVLSLRTKDQTTAEASTRLFRLATTPRSMLAVPRRTIERAIYPVGFYRTKARHIHDICRDLLARYGGQVPDEIDELLTLKGVGRKTANLVVTLGFRKPGICVDIHVHRISNRLGYIRTKSPAQSEEALRRKLPRRHWIVYNDLLVPFGQNLCTPVSPRCSECKLTSYCERVGVVKSR
ncbi:MAG TPA: endonuclease III [Nitrospirales bacterium]|nr:endonuclease III [Nitrospirales bacterium]